MYTYVILFLCFQYLATVFSQEGDSCDLATGGKGTCIKVQQCPHAVNLLKEGGDPQICGFVQLESLVCCKEEKQNQKHGELSIKKCKEFYPFPRHGIFIGGAELSLAKEFPHMAAIGFGNKPNIEWLCGGSLVSYDFILTAAHCLHSRNLGPARWVRLGELDFANETDDAQPQDFAVKLIVSHPDYNPPSRYHDIGLIQLDRAANRTPWVDIACLDVERKHTEQKMVATGWGRTEFSGEVSSYLLKTNLDVVSDNCQRFYKNLEGALPNGIVDDLHVCAGGKGYDTCEGDSGGPLQVRNYAAGSVPLVYYIVGVTSFGKPCGLSGTPGVYTRVYNYLPWLESVLWPS